MHPESEESTRSLDHDQESDSNTTLVPVLVTKDLTELEVVNGLLESAGIQTSLQGQGQLRMLGGQHGLSQFMQTFSKRPLGAKLLVNPADAQAALELIDSLQHAEPFDYDPEAGSEDATALPSAAEPGKDF